MGQLVREQACALGCRGGELTGAKDDIAADCVGAGLQCVRGGPSRSIRVQSNPAEVVAKARLESGTNLLGQRLTAAPAVRTVAPAACPMPTSAEGAGFA
jgi:hypothetical protein